MSESSVLSTQPLYTWYDVDWDKVHTLDDLKLIIKAVDMKVTIKNIHFDEISHLLKESK